VADDFKKVITKEIPDVKIVGEDFAPIGQKDFGHYISKIPASGAEIIFTENHVNDFSFPLRRDARDDPVR
jgi:ABC-type branched-subunit amino acid transport system substrate-binding protein